jgi:predicted esterase
VRATAFVSLFILAAIFVAVPADAKPKKVKLHTKKIQDLATRWMKARPKTHFERWNRRTREALLDEARALGPIPEGSLPQVTELLWKVVKKHGPKAKGRKLPTPYGKKAEWIQSDAGGKAPGLILGLHGGGPGAGSAGEATKWKIPGHMGMYPQGIRLVHDTWNSVHGERFLLTLIEIAKVQHNVDPDRVYAMGFSMGGTGSMFMAGRHPDLLAGAIPAHGIVPAIKVKVFTPEETGPLEHGLLPNLRNVAVYFYTGSKDKNCEPGTFLHAWNILEALRKDDPEGYRLLRFRCHEGVAHSFPPGEPGNGYKFIREQRRHAFPTRIVWEYNDAPWPGPDPEDEGKATRRPKEWMYWLRCKEPRDRMLVTAVRRDEGDAHVVDLAVPKMCFPDDFTIYLNDKMYDVKKEVVARVDGKEVYRGRPQPDFVTVLESLDAKLDRTLVFDRKIAIPEPD